MAKLLLGILAFALFIESTSRRVQTQDELNKLKSPTEPSITSEEEEEKSVDRELGDRSGEGHSTEYVAFPHARTLATTLENLVGSARFNSSVESFIGKWMDGDKPMSSAIGKLDLAHHGIELALCLFVLLVSAVVLLIALSTGCRAKHCCPRAQRNNNRKQYKHKNRVIYEWEQFAKKIVMYIELPSGVDKNNLDIRISPRHIRVGRKGKQPFIKEQLYLMVDEENSSWKVVKNELQICLMKSDLEEWHCVLLPHLQSK
jgi:hypothetical protein|mmetsp:Transcript_10311/g.16977  ORF Transcript_10311/g.16977 Transcript_10311/m.16977 type:complete len:259 (-) Transcript_10311:19-795(-)